MTHEELIEKIRDALEYDKRCEFMEYLADNIFKSNVFVNVGTRYNKDSDSIEVLVGYCAEGKDKSLTFSNSYTFYITDWANQSREDIVKDIEQRCQGTWGTGGFVNKKELERMFR